MRREVWKLLVLAEPVAWLTRSNRGKRTWGWDRGEKKRGIWLTCGYHMTITWLSHDDHMMITWSHDDHMTITWWSHDHNDHMITWRSHDHMTITWWSHDNHMAITWWSHDDHMTITWPTCQSTPCHVSLCSRVPWAEMVEKSVWEALLRTAARSSTHKSDRRLMGWWGRDAAQLCFISHTYLQCIY